MCIDLIFSSLINDDGFIVSGVDFLRSGWVNLNQIGGSLSIGLTGQNESDRWVSSNRMPGSNCIGIITGEEIAELLEFVTGQNSDGYGEGLEQRPIKTPDGEIYVSFWNRENYCMKLEQEMKNNSPDLGYGGQVMG